MTVDFYHLAASPLERVLPSIAEKVLASGGKLLVVGDDALLARIDGQLWTWRPDSFLPHGRAGADDGADALQPVLLSADPVAPNGARNVALADGVWREEALSFDRTFYFFDSARLDDARGAWRALRDREGVERRYWKQDERGRWIEGP